MILLFLMGIFLAGTMWELYYRYQWAKEITVDLWFESDIVYAKQETTLYEVIENKKRMPVPTLEVGFHTRRELDFADTDNTQVSDYIYKRDIFSVLGSQKIVRKIPVKCTKRGRYQIDSADLISYTLFYKKRYNKEISVSTELFVYAKKADVSEIMTVCSHLLGVLQCARNLYEDPFAFRTIRDYTKEDPMKTINWKASAKMGTWMVNTFDSVRSQKAMIFLDVEDSGILKREELVEESIAICATIIRKLLGQSVEVGFAYNAKDGGAGYLEMMMPSNKKSSLHKLEQGLAQYSAVDGTQDFGQMIDTIFQDVFARSPLSTDTLLLVITKNLNTSLLQKITQYTQGIYQALIVVPVFRGESKQRNFEQESSNRENIHVLIKEVERA